MRNLRKFDRPVGITIVLVGVGCFVVQWFFGFARDSITLRGMDWPVRESTQAVRFPDGRYAIGVDAIGRIQVYSPSRQFLYGWQTHYHTNTMRLQSDGALDVYTPLKYRRPHRWAERVYDSNGTLLSTGYSDRNPADLPGQGPAPITLPHTLPSWLAFPLYGPFPAFALILIGAVPTLATTPPELLKGYRRKLMYLPPRRG